MLQTVLWRNQDSDSGGVTKRWFGTGSGAMLNLGNFVVFWKGH